MLTVAQDRLMTLATRRGKNVSIHLFGQEINPETYAICKADMLLKGDGDQAEHISYGSTLSLDGNATRQFDFMLSNPPYGKSWKTDAEKLGGKKEILDSRFNTYLDGGEQLTMIPRTSDGQLLFLLNNVAKMKKDTPLGSRIAEVHNGSSIFTGDAGSGESNARRYMIENDLVEAIIAVPENMFYNTGIGTFIWVLSNKKEERRKGKIQLIDATTMKSALRKNMGKKNCEFTEEIRKEIVRIFLAMEESVVSMILNNEDFGYWNVTVERPLRLRVRPDRPIPADTFKKSDEYDGVIAAIAWLAHQLIGLEQDGRPMLDSVIVVTDRRILDKQIRDTIKQFMQVGNTVAWAEHSGDLTKAITDGKRIIVTTIEKFPYIVPQIGAEHKDNHFAIIIDEAHSGQSGRNSAQMNLALSGLASDDEMDNEDKINAMMEGRKLLNNASYFAFTATPKNKTLETFGVPYQDGDDVKHRPFHVYTMKQAIQEGFILDVLQYYTPIDSFYKLMKTVEDDPMFDKKRAQKKLRSFVESDSYTIAKKAAMMVDHFHEQVIAKGKIGGQARAMVVTSRIPRCIEYYYAINKCLADRHSPYKTIIAFSGENKYQGQEPPLTSAGLNGFPDAKIPKEFKKDPYRILIVADMFQTGFDEPLLHTMYVDTVLYDIKAVQTLSRLNRCCPKKYDTFVLDFANKPEMIQESFSRYYRTTILSGETDPNKLYDLVATMEEYQVFSNEDVERLVNLYLDGADRDKLDPTLDACTAVYKQLDTDDQIKFKSAAKAFVRTYGFLGAILPYGNADWERLSIFLNLLIPKLPSPREDDLSQGILEKIDLESYRNEAREVMSIRLEDADTEVAPVPAGKVGHIVEPEMDLLSVILSNFNDMFGNINWNDADNVRRQILEIPAMVSKDEKYQNAMRNSDEQSARLESERALQQVIFSIMADNMELFKQFQDNPSFKKWLSDLVFNLTYNKDGKPYENPDAASTD